MPGMAHPDLLNLDRKLIQELQAPKLQALLAEIIPANAFYTAKFRQAGIKPSDIKKLADCNGIPFTTRAELQEDQVESPPYGTNLTYPITRFNRLCQTSGTHGKPLRWLDTPQS